MPEAVHFKRKGLIQSVDVSGHALTLLRRSHLYDLILFSLYKSKTKSVRVHVANRFLKVDHKLLTKSSKVFDFCFVTGTFLAEPMKSTRIIRFCSVGGSVAK